MQKRQDLDEMLILLSNKWIVQDLQGDSVRSHAYNVFGLPIHMTIDDDKVKQVYVSSIFQAMRLYMLFLANGLIGVEGEDADDNSATDRRKFNQIFQTIVHMYEMVSAEHRIRGITNSQSC
jgi:hypothetical protein